MIKAAIRKTCKRAKRSEAMMASMSPPSVDKSSAPRTAWKRWTGTATETMVMQALSRLSTRQTMVFVTHKLQLLDFVNRVMIMDSGVRVADGPKEAVLQALKEGKIQGVRRV